MYKGILKTQEQHLSVYKYKEQKTTKSAVITVLALRVDVLCSLCMIRLQ